MPVMIVSHPYNTAIKSDEYARFYVSVNGDVSAYQWQYLSPGSSVWRDSSVSSAKSATLVIVATVSNDGYKYRCKVTGTDGSSAYSDSAELIVINVRKGNGLVPLDTLSALASSIRAKTKTVGRMLPDDMPALVDTIEAPLSGTLVIGENDGVNRYSLGIPLPEYENYCFMLVSGTNLTSRYGGIHRSVGGNDVNLCFVGEYAFTSVWNIDKEAGTIFNQNFSPSAGTVYQWIYYKEAGI